MSRLDRYGERIDEGAADRSGHDVRCQDGWVGDDADHPRPCPACRPWLTPCTACHSTRSHCDAEKAITGWRCCPACPHRPKPLRRSSR